MLISQGFYLLNKLLNVISTIVALKYEIRMRNAYIAHTDSGLARSRAAALELFCCYPTNGKIQGRSLALGAAPGEELCESERAGEYCWGERQNEAERRSKRRHE